MRKETSGQVIEFAGKVHSGYSTLLFKRLARELTDDPNSRVMALSNELSPTEISDKIEEQLQSLGTLEKSHNLFVFSLTGLEWKTENISRLVHPANPDKLFLHGFSEDDLKTIVPQLVEPEKAIFYSLQTPRDRDVTLDFASERVMA